MSASTSAVLLDRDGTLIVERHYLSDPDLIELEEGVVEGLCLLRDTGLPLVVLSNQSGVGRGRFTLEQAFAVNERLAQVLRERGIGIAGWYVCPHTPDAACDCRKPRPGMALRAARELNLDLRGSFVVGDKRSDLELADAIEATGLLVVKGHAHDSLDWARTQERLIFDNFSRAADYISRRHNDDTLKSISA